jgi:hypothetical protein
VRAPQLLKDFHPIGGFAHDREGRLRREVRRSPSRTIGWSSARSTRMESSERALQGRHDGDILPRGPPGDAGEHRVPSPGEERITTEPPTARPLAHVAQPPAAAASRAPASALGGRESLAVVPERRRDPGRRHAGSGAPRCRRVLLDVLHALLQDPVERPGERGQGRGKSAHDTVTLCPVRPEVVPERRARRSGPSSSSTQGPRLSEIRRTSLIACSRSGVTGRARSRSGPPFLEPPQPEQGGAESW